MLNAAAGGEGGPRAFPVVNRDARTPLKQSSVVEDDSPVKGREVRGQAAVFSHGPLCAGGGKSLHTAAGFNCIC